MFDKLQNFLSAQSEISEKQATINLENIWQQREHLVYKTLSDLSLCTDAILGGKSSSYGARFGRLCQLLPPSSEPLEGPPDDEVDIYSFIDDDDFLSEPTKLLGKKPSGAWPFFDDEAQIAAFRTLIADDYTPPTDPFALQFYLCSLWLYYFYISKTIDDLSLPLILQFDFAMATTVAQAAAVATTIDIKGRRDKDRTFSSGKAHKKIKESWKHKELTIYQTLDKSEKAIWKKLSGRKQSELILERLQKKYPGVPGLETIRKHLMELRKSGKM